MIRLNHTAQGGVDAWDPTKYLNVWVGEVDSNLLGYALFPVARHRTLAMNMVLLFDYRYTTGALLFHYQCGTTLAHGIGHCYG